MRRLLRFLRGESGRAEPAKERGATNVIALSTQAFSFFTSVVGFVETDKDALPDSRLKAYEDSGRNSKVLTKRL